MKSTPKDVFLHLLSIITLYVSSGALITLFFQYINILIPDKLQPIYFTGVAEAIRFSMASLIIVFPVYIFSCRILNEDYKSEPGKRELKIRKWLVYFTLFVAAGIIIGDLVSLIYSFLGGEITGRFILKIFSILLVVGSIFFYYLMDLKEKLTHKSLKTLAWAVSAVVLVSVAAGFFTAGSPLKARLYRFDEQRVTDLQVIQDQIIFYWTQKEVLPKNLDELENSLSGYIPPKDPETGASYIYDMKNKLNFELCAEFNMDTMAILRTPEVVYPAKDIYNQKWDHGAGKVCFDRSIDPELYKQKVKIVQ